MEELARDLPRRRLLAFVRAATGSAEGAEDLAQEALLRACRSGMLDGERDLFPWLCTVVRNLIVDRFRRARRASFASLDQLGYEPVARDEQEERERKEREAAQLARLREALQCLAESEREAFLLFYEQDLSIRAISDRLGRPAGTVKSWLHRARERLRRHLAREDEDGTLR